MEYKIEYDKYTGILFCVSSGETTKDEIIPYAKEAFGLIEKYGYKRMLTDHTNRRLKAKYIDADFLIGLFKDVKFPQGFKWAYLLSPDEKMKPFYMKYEREGSRAIKREIEIFYDRDQAVKWLSE